MARTSKNASKDDAPHGVPDADTGADAPTIDAVLAGLEQVVAQLEGGDLPLEEALARFERGVALARRGSAMLDRVEERVEVLLAERDRPVPFRAEDQGPAQENEP